MKLAFSKPTGTDEERQLLFRSFGPVGYDGLQLKAGQYQGYIDEPDRFVDEWGQCAGVASALITGGNLDAQSNEVLRRVFRFAAAVGSDLVILCLGIPREGLSREQIGDQLRALASQVEAGTVVLGDKELALPPEAEFEISYKLKRKGGHQIEVEIEWGGPMKAALLPTE